MDNHPLLYADSFLGLNTPGMIHFVLRFSFCGWALSHPLSFLNWILGIYGSRFGFGSMICFPTYSGLEGEI